MQCVFGVCVCLGQVEDELYNPIYPLRLGMTYFFLNLILLLSCLPSPPLLSILWPCCGRVLHEELHCVRLCCNINGLLMDYGMVSAGLRERGGPPDAPPLLTAGPTPLNYSSDPPPWMLPVLPASTTRERCAVCTLLLCEPVKRWGECEKWLGVKYSTAASGGGGGSKCFRLTCPWGPIMGLLGLCGGGCACGEGWDPGGPWWRKMEKDVNKV